MPHNYIQNIITSRVFETFLNILNEKNIIKKRSWHHIFLYCFLIYFISYAYFFEKNYTNKSMKRIYDSMSAADTGFNNLVKSCHMSANRKLVYFK